METKTKKTLLISSIILLVVINISALSTIYYHNKIQEKKFVEISKYAKSVICSRCSPGQKSEVVKMIKESDRKLVTLSIGDGGNDVPMITEAHIGNYLII